MTASKIDVKKYSTLIFDCDGVILNSNKIKTKGFHKVASQFGDEPANRLVQYHLRNGGISRYQKFNYLFSEILGLSPLQTDIDRLAKEYGEYVFNSLLHCEVVSGLKELRDELVDSTWMIVSGGDQVELNKIFAKRGLATLFDGGIFGSPETKEEIIKRERARGNIRLPAIVLGDSRYDHIAAMSHNIDFAFVSGWTELEQWQEYCMAYKIVTVPDIKSLLLGLDYDQKIRPAA